jgi:hypothetical protein
MNNLIEQKLKTIKEFQDKYPTSHVGGSIGLMIRGIDLKRDLSKSDLDITVDEFDIKNISVDSVSERSDQSDFDLALQKDFENHSYLKIDLRICPEPSFDVVEFNGEKYNVSKVRDILFWKKRYASKGHLKHKYDIIAIETGVRPEEPVIVYTDDLPF